MKLPPLSNRLLACCQMIKQGDRVADIGCDHGYLGIYLLTNQIADSVIAADVNEGPLQSAFHNGHKFGVADRMRFYLSDGLKNVPTDFDTMVCAGMGADTMISIIGNAPWLKSEKYRLILQCQSRRPELRKFLYEQGFCILRETLAQDGKFIYPVIEAVYRPAAPLSESGYHITPALLESGSPLLPAFYQRVLSGIKTTVDGLSAAGGDKYEYYHSLYHQLLKLEDCIYGDRQ